ncbi:MAG: sigma-70 family RNA polymerase sigma factor [Chitinophagaceae bacterium]|nr:sigma-70 family RNA polymerase sigma factor [Chitinophagaceae bacterium]
MPASDPVMHQLVNHLFRQESGKMIAVLTNILGFGQYETAEDLVQDTLLQAMNTWSYGGIPEKPEAWLYRVAHNKAIDLIRRKKRFWELTPEYAHLLESEWTDTEKSQQIFLENEIQDSQLRMIFACCHPAIPAESQVAFVLKTLCGLSVREIAKAFLSPEETISKRIYRAKEKIKTAGIALTVPQGNELPDRMDAVLTCLYLLFNEGYNSSHPEMLIREDLCYEAMRLCYLLTENNRTVFPRCKALLSLFCFQASRLRARLDDKGNIILIKYQDRSQWSKPLIQKGYQYLVAGAEPFSISPYHLEAAIASLHAVSPSFEKTDWKAIHQLYEKLYELQPSPVVAMNKAIASAYAMSKEQALIELEAIKGLDKNHLYYASMGELYMELNEPDKAKNLFEKALLLTDSLPEQQLLLAKISVCQSELS